MSHAHQSLRTDRRFFGVVEGIVSEVRNEGQIKVTYPWLDGSTDQGQPQMVSEWCRVSQFFAGPDHGAFFIPKRGSEVALGFIHGDMRRPIIIGGLFNGVDQPPGTDSDMDTHVRHLRIQSPTGHRISMLDPEEPGAAGAVVIENSKGDYISLSTTGTVRIKARGALELEGATVRINGRVVASNNNTI
ncbi:MAG: phage baseplate assembly protein V [Gammaproteobacteria bacterium]